MTAPSAPAPAADLWEELRAVLRAALAVFGAPAELWDDVVLPRCEARRLARWIAALEAAARALLLVMAAGLPKPAPARPRPKPPAAAAIDPCTDGKATGGDAPGDPVPGAAGDGIFEAASPETPGSEAWARVGFRMTPRPSVGGPPGAPGVRRFLSVRGLAFRLEALVRVAAAPAPFARRLARRLGAAPGLPARALKKPPSPKGCPPPYEELVEDAFTAARAAGGGPGAGLRLAVPPPNI